MGLIHEISAFSYGGLRCHLGVRQRVDGDGAYAVAILHHKATKPHEPGAIMFFLHSPAEIAAFRALSEALAAQDVVDEVGA